MTSKSQIRIEDDHHNPARREGEVAMASEQSKYLVELYASIKERLSKPDIDLATTRDIVENLHLAAIEPEREVMALVVSGLLNKQVGDELGISEITVKAHRGKVMRKMKADSLADLVKMAARLRLTPISKLLV